MPPTPSTPTQQRRRGGSATIDEVLPKDGAPEADTGGDGAAPPAPEAAPGQGRVLPTLPTAKTSLSGILEQKTIVLYGEAGIGKSTLASEFGEVFFFDCAGELSDLEVYRGAVTDWTNFREWAAAYAAEMAKPEPMYAGCVVDTADLLGTFCAAWVRGQLGVAHESDADWGKGWTLVRETFHTALAKLAALPGGLILVSHAKQVEIKTRNQVYDRNIPTLTGGVRDACVNMADLVLFIDWDDAGQGRVIHTKGDRFHEAKERGQQPRLPAAIPWPIGASGYDILRTAWYGEPNGKET